MIHVLKIQCCQNDVNLVDKIDENIVIKQNYKKAYYILKKEVLMIGLYFNALLDKYLMFKYFGNMPFPGTGTKKIFIEQNKKQMNSFIQIIDKNDLDKTIKILLSLYLFGNKFSVEKNATIDDLYKEHSLNIDATMVYYDKDYVVTYLVNIDFIMIYIINKINQIFDILNHNEKNTDLSLNFYKSTDTLMLFNKFFNFLTFFMSIKITSQNTLIMRTFITVNLMESFEKFMKKYIQFYNKNFMIDLFDKVVYIVRKISPNKFNDVDHINHYISALMVNISVIYTFSTIFNTFLLSFDFFGPLYNPQYKMFWDDDIQKKCEENKQSKDFVLMRPIIQSELDVLNNYFFVIQQNLENNFLDILKHIEKKNELIDIKPGIFCFFKPIQYILSKIKQTSKNCLTNKLNMLKLQFYKNINYKTIDIHQFKKLKRKYENIRNIKDYSDIIIDQTTKKNKIEK